MSNWTDPFYQPSRKWASWTRLRLCYGKHYVLGHLGLLCLQTCFTNLARAYLCSADRCRHIQLMAT
eukprot:jgi/Botrbrau1/22722/Bobra.0132s0061.1